MILFGGFYINVDSLPLAIQWVQYLSIMRWGFSGLAINELKGVRFSCDDVDDEESSHAAITPQRLTKIINLESCFIISFYLT